MKEKLYTIPVNEAFDTNLECPLCAMMKTLEQDAIDYTMGSSYMEDYIRLETDKIGFCPNHIPKLYATGNRLGLGLVLKTHMDKTITDLESLAKSGGKLTGKKLFSKSSGPSGVSAYVSKLETTCFACNRVEGFFERYIATVYYMYETDSDFRKKFNESKGFCTSHYGLLYDKASSNLSGDILNQFIQEINTLYLNNFKRVRDDLEWFTDKFDYRYINEPWKNSKDALIRAILKINGVHEDSLE